MQRVGSAVALLVVLAAAPCRSADTYALVVSGASGGPQYSAKYDGWRTALATTLKSTFGYPDDRVIALGEARRAQIEQAVRGLGARMTADDVLFVALMGHGADEKFNLVGPDMTAADWAGLLKPMAGRVVFVDMSSSSFPFFAQLSAPGRIVITAAESSAQQFETVFPDFFVRAFTEPSADADKDGRVSIFEAFEWASAGVRAWFDQHNQLPTERALLNDEAAARATWLQPRVVAANDPKARRQVEIESAIASLKAKRSTMPAAAYDAEMERLLTELARVMLK